MKIDRVVRVFISSTFRDMQEERDYLVKHIFPELRSRCRARRVEFVEVDLRWGITEEQSQKGEVLPICLAEIENCRPYFIGLLGERYGYVPDEIDPDLIRQHPWLEQHREHSYTELEILHGVLQNPQMAERAFFYFRDLGYVNQIPSELRHDFLSEDPVEKSKLKILKDRIRRSRLPLMENYPNPEAVGRLILKDLWQAIDQEYPLGAPERDPLDKEALEHKAWGDRLTGFYQGHQSDFDRLNQHIESGDPPLVLVGENGIGKSALLAAWAQRHRKSHPQDFLLVHFIGSTPESSNYLEIIKRIMGEILRHYPREDVQSNLTRLWSNLSEWSGLKESRQDYSLPQIIPPSPEKLRSEFPKWLEVAAGLGRWIIILDGLNQLEDVDHALDLGWLPERWRQRVILSTLPGRTLDAMKKLGWTTHQVGGLPPERRKSVIQNYLGYYRKGLNERHLDCLADSPATGNPLYLKALLEELRLFGGHKGLDSQINYYLGATSVPALYDKILARWENDYTQARPGLVEESMSLLGAARRGLYESELLELLGTAGGPMPHAHWATFYFAIQESLVNRAGLLNFFHEHLRQAVSRRYLSSPVVKRGVHLRLADYFTSCPVSQRQIDELPWQLAEAQAWDRLKDCLADLDMLPGLMTGDKIYELLKYWQTLEGLYDPVSTYHAALAHRKQSSPADRALPVILNSVANLYILLARYYEAEPLYRQALAISERGSGLEHPETALIITNLSFLLEQAGTYAEADSLSRRSLAIHEKILGTAQADTLDRLSFLTDFFKAEHGFFPARVHQEVLEGQTETAIEDDLVTPMMMGKLPIWGLFGTWKALKLTERSKGPEHPETAAALLKLANAWMIFGAYEKALALILRAQQIRENVFGLEHPKTIKVYATLAKAHQYLGNYDEALTLYRKVMEHQKRFFRADHPEVIEINLNIADCHFNLGACEEALSLFHQVLQSQEKILGQDHPDTAITMHKIAVLYKQMGDLDQAWSLSNRALIVLKQAGEITDPDLIKCWKNWREIKHIIRKHDSYIY